MASLVSTTGSRCSKCLCRCTRLQASPPLSRPFRLHRVPTILLFLRAIATHRPSSTRLDAPRKVADEFFYFVVCVFCFFSFPILTASLTGQLGRVPERFTERDSFRDKGETPKTARDRRATAASLQRFLLPHVVASKLFKHPLTKLFAGSWATMVS
jgi:hypothetical protein